MEMPSAEAGAFWLQCEDSTASAVRVLPPLRLDRPSEADWQMVMRSAVRVLLHLAHSHCRFAVVHHLQRRIFLNAGKDRHNVIRRHSRKEMTNACKSDATRRDISHPQTGHLLRV